MIPLSPNNVINALVFPVLLSITLTLFLLPGRVPYISNPPVAILLYIILFCWIYYAARQTYDLHYDQEFLHLTSLTKKTQLPLTAIKRIQKSNEGIKVRGLTSWRYILQFHPDTKIEDQVIYEVNGSRKVETFASVVRQRNTTVLVKLT
jgi:Ca2+/Na+ antiporter